MYVTNWRLKPAPENESRFMAPVSGACVMGISYRRCNRIRSHSVLIWDWVAPLVFHFPCQIGLICLSQAGVLLKPV